MRHAPEPDGSRAGVVGTGARGGGALSHPTGVCERLAETVHRGGRGTWRLTDRMTEGYSVTGECREGGECFPPPFRMVWVCGMGGRTHSRRSPQSQGSPRQQEADGQATHPQTRRTARSGLSCCRVWSDDYAGSTSTPTGPSTSASARTRSRPYTRRPIARQCATVPAATTQAAELVALDKGIDSHVDEALVDLDNGNSH